ncbi:MAG: hypothetical protein KF734_19845 [Saprospiraceae bacterium]|nr:hypothetical protein [Saprospiraceae bacterium]
MSINFLSRFPFIITLMAFLILAANARAQTIRYVKPSGSGDGTSWANASGDLQAMIDASASGDEVWVAAGVYKPTTGADRTISFSLKSGVAVYGGFPDTGDPDMDDRDWETYVTTLSGDIGAANDNSDNSYHVVFNQNVNNTALLDGFAISGGNATGDVNLHRNGGGMYNQASSPGISHCVFSGNGAGFRGGGMYNQDSHPAVSNCTFSNNTAGVAGGGAANNGSSAGIFTSCAFSFNSSGDVAFGDGAGGVLNSGGAAPVFNSCTFTGNSSAYGGGGMMNFSSSPTLNDCTFSQNTTGNGGGGGMLNNNASPVLTNCVFSQNIGTNGGGGMYNYFASPEMNNCSFTSNTAGTFSSGGGMSNSFSAPTLNDCTFTGNTCPGFGGGVESANESSCTFNRCVFTSNTAFGGGGIYFNYNTSDVLNQCLFAGNSAENSGGGVSFANGASPNLTNCNFIGNTSFIGGAVSVQSSSSATLTNCSMSGNSASTGGAMYTFSTQAALTNCILWGNSSGIGANSGVFLNASHSIIQQNSGVYPGTGNLNLDPLFVEQPPVGLGTTGNLQLQECSPAIDAGTNTGAPNEDFGGNTRPFNAVGTPESLTDMGAWEYQDTYTPAAAPSVSISGPTQVSCSVPAVYTATPVDGGASPVYQWKINGNNVGANSPTFSTMNLQSGDVVSCVMVSSISCAYPILATSNSIQVTLDPPPGDPSKFGNGEWRVYAWNAGGAEPGPGSWSTNYSGYYVATGLNFNTQNQWNADLSPSAAPGYQGCAVGNDNHSFSAKRKGFTCGYYRISIESHDDAAQLWLDGTMVWEHIGCCDNHPNEWEGFLDADSEVEFRVTEGGGGSHGAISFQLVTPAIVGLDGLCSGNPSATLSVSGGLQGDYEWSTGETTPSIEITTSGNYSVTIGHSGGCSVNASGTAASPEGDPTVFGVGEWRVYAWNAGGATPDANTWNANYAGYYTVSSVNLNTQNQWNNTASPSSASNYVGCPVGNDNHSWSAKRKDFTCGNYVISIDGHKDHAELWLDGVKVWEHSGCCDNHPNAWYGLLDEQTEIEFRVTHGTGTSYGAIFIQQVTPTLTGLNNLCGNPSATLAVSNNPAGNYLWSTGETTPSIQITSGGSYAVTLSTGSGCSAVLSGQAQGPAGDPAVFGDNVWNVYAWNAGGAEPTAGSWNTAYSGFYTANSLNLNTQQQWNNNQSPAMAPGYQGCPVGIDNHSFSAKRKGFPCDFYRISIDGHDDAAQLWIDGDMVWEHIGCCDNHPNAWQGFLGADSEVEFRVTEGGGESYGSISFHAGSITLTGTPTVCPGASNGMVSAPQLSGASYLWNTGANTASISGLSAGLYSVTVGSSAGCDDVSGSFTIEESITITGASTICQGGSATLQANINGPVIWNSGSFIFEKTSPGQADAIVPSTHITRGYSGFIYNAVTQNGPSASGVCGPVVNNVMWALGYIDDWASLTYTNTMPIPNCSGSSIPGLQLVMHLVAENIYLQVTFNYWQGGGGGNFTYTRTTGPSYLWSTGETTPSISVSAGGTYTVSTGNGDCTAGHTVTVSQPTFTATPSNGCSGPNDGQIAVSGETGGTGPYLYSIDNGTTYHAGATFTGLAAETYQVRIKDVNDCESAAIPVMVEACNTDIQISGKLIWEHDGASGVGSATVALTGDQIGSVTTPTAGTYSFTVTSGSNFTVTPTKTINKLNGVTTADVTRIQQHIAGANPITSLYKIVAADVNKDNAVTMQDAVTIHQALAGNPVALANFKTSWRFVPTSHTMNNPPWGFPEKITLTGVNNDMPDQDFFGIKTGDVVTPFTNPANFNHSEASGFALNAPDRVLQFGEQVAVTFSANQFSDLAALQFALKFDVEKLALAEIRPLTGLPISEENFGAYNISEGELRVVWSQAEGVLVEEGAAIFTLTFNVLETGGTLSEVLRLADEVLEGHAYTSALSDNEVKLNFFSATSANAPIAQPQIELLQNRPNPFSGQTVIGFVLPENCEAQLRVFDVSGKMLAEKKGQYAAGRHEEIFNLEGASGVLWYELVTPFGILTKKMVAVK